MNVYAQPAIEKTQLAFDLAHESWDLPAGERMGLSSVALSQALSPGLSIGLQAFTATAGQRGGFITLGTHLRATQQLTGPWGIEADAFVGGGAGAGGQTLAGGGLMLRAAAGFNYELSNAWTLGMGLSRVDFPSGAIHSTQPYVRVSVPFDVLTRGARQTGHALASSTASALTPSSLGVQHLAHQLIPTVKQAHVNGGAKRTNGKPQTDMGLIGIEWRTHLDPTWFVALKTEAAHQGASAGYMDIMGGTGLRMRLGQGTALYSDVMVGGGGGGAVHTGGGLLVSARVGAQLDLGYGWLADASITRLKATRGSYAANALGLGLGYRFGERSERDFGGHLRHDLRVRLGAQRYIRTGNWRSNPGRDIGLVGAHIDLMAAPHWYVTGVGMAAATGGAGAYMTGQMGAGVRLALNPETFAEAEALLGAAGGGGLNTGSGSMYQVNLNFTRQLQPNLELILSIGKARAFGGDFKANVVGLSLARRLSVLSAK